MCTALALNMPAFTFGRNLDLEHRFGEKVVIAPRNYSFPLKSREEVITRYGMIGMATVAGVPLFAEGANEKGLAMAGLYFPGNAVFFEPEAGKLNLAPYELIPYFLGKYARVKEAMEEIERLNITNIPFAEGFPVADLHWILADEEDCVVLEQTERGLSIYKNPVGILTNNPPFDYQLTNLRNYRHLNPRAGENTLAPRVALSPYGQGMGALGLPGDASPASRFVKAAFLASHSPHKEEETEAVSQFFHILDAVSMVEGSVITEEGLYDTTTYSCCIRPATGTYYYKTYNNHQITAVKMTEESLNRSELSVFPLREGENIYYEN